MGREVEVAFRGATGIWSSRLKLSCGYCIRLCTVIIVMHLVRSCACLTQQVLSPLSPGWIFEPRTPNWGLSIIGDTEYLDNVRGTSRLTQIQQTSPLSPLFPAALRKSRPPRIAVLSLSPINHKHKTFPLRSASGTSSTAHTHPSTMSSTASASVLRASRPLFRSSANFARGPAFRQNAGRRWQSTAGTTDGAAQPSWFKRMWDSPIGLKTVHFWAPVMKWSIVLAGIADFARPAEKLSLTQNAALTATGLIWTRWCLIIKPKNYL